VRRCVKCVLPETFPGVTINVDGICNHCAKAKSAREIDGVKQDYKGRFDGLVEQYRGKGAYDAIMCYSGGKDSTFTLAVLREQYDLRVLAFVFDNGFMSAQTPANIAKVAEHLGLDTILFKPRFDMMKRLFRECARRSIYPAKTLERASTICTTCMGLLKFSALRVALEKRIPFIAYGWSPGQAPIRSSIMKNNPQMAKSMQKGIFDPLYKLVGEEIRPYFLADEHFASDREFPYNVSPLAFLDYDEHAIIEKNAALGWVPPTDTDANSTNCLLNSFGNMVHKRQFNFHPYVFEMSNLVREGYLDREAALKKITEPEDTDTVAYVAERLELDNA